LTKKLDKAILKNIIIILFGQNILTNLKNHWALAQSGLTLLLHLVYYSSIYDGISLIDDINQYYLT
jgi:hypothetical protein